MKLDMELREGALALYRGRPARVNRLGERVEIDLGDETVRVRAKDLRVLHPGPLDDLRALDEPLPGEMRAAWDMLAGNPTSLAEIAELAYGRFTPATAWAAWQFVSDGLYFTGEPEQLQAASVAEEAERRATRERAAAEAQAWQDFLARARRGEWRPADGEHLNEVELLAWGKSTHSRLLRELGWPETPEVAHALLLSAGRWDVYVNPSPRRLGLPLQPPELPVSPLPDEKRLDLTHLAAYAIDDEGNETPDDAISLEEQRVWVHVADVAALVPPGSPLDLEARGRAETLHLPEGHVHLFPPEVTQQLGLGLQPTSPALSFGIELDEAGAIRGVLVRPSWVRVKRLSYAAASAQIEDDAALAGLEQWMDLRRQRRLAAGAVDIDLPEVDLHVSTDGEIRLEPELPLRARRIVEEAMILAGEAAGWAAQRQGLDLLYTVQDAPESRVPTDRLSGMFAMRRLLHRSQYRATPGPHGGLGLPHYTQATSPLRRYLDLVVHQQLRAGQRGVAPLGESALLERIGMVEAILPALRRAEVASERHWTLVYLLQRPDWHGEAVLVERRGGMGTWLLPALGLEARAAAPADLPLDMQAGATVMGIDLPKLEFSIHIDHIVGGEAML
jgi:exoribonuclease-2